MRHTMRRQPTTAILVIAILHLVGGSIGLLGSLCGCGGLLMADSLSSIMSTPPTLPARPGQSQPIPAPPGAKEVMQYMKENVPGYLPFTIASICLSFLLDLMLISGGIGLLKMQPWARWLSLAYAPISILMHVGSFIYQLVWVMPVTQALYAKTAAAMPGFGSLMTFSTGIGVVAALLIVMYPIAVLIVLLLPSTAAAFRGEAPVREADLPIQVEDIKDDWREPPPRSEKFRP